MSYEDFKRRKFQKSEIINPYVKKKVEPPKEDQTGLDEFDVSLDAKEKALMTTSLLNGQNKYLFSEVKTLQREIKELKEDIASLYCMLLNEDPKPLTPVEAREKYSIFKTNKKHLLNRKTNETETETV